MKKQIPLFFAILATLFFTLTASAQGEWKWANYWTGNDDPLDSNNPYNYVVRTAFDDDGNVYVFGSFGGSARIQDQTLSTWIFDNVEVVASNTSGIILVKFDSLGNHLWSRVIKNSKQGEDCRPYDMALRDGKIVISGHYSFDYNFNEQLWFLDTLVTQQTALSYPFGEYHPPYTFTGGCSSFISFLDLDGNVLENHFVKILSRKQENRLVYPINTGAGACPMCVNSNGDIYIATAITYEGPDTLPWTVVIDEDTAKTYDYYLPGRTEFTGISNMMLFKFSLDFDLLWAKYLVNHTVGLSPNIPVDTVNPLYTPWVYGLSIDNDDNLYFSGFLMDMWRMDEYNQYPMRIYWDSTHYATIADRSLARSLPFIIKYDYDGNVQWANQAYVKNEPQTEFYNYMVWYDNYADNSGVYLMGQAGANQGQNPLFYFDNEANYLPLQPNTYQHTSFFVRFDKETGSFDALGQTPGLHTFAYYGSRPAVENNHLLGMYQNAFSQGSLLCYYNTNGHFIKADTVLSNDETHKAFKTVVNEDGKLLCDFICKQDLTFGHDLTLNFDDHQHSHAVIALRYDPSILEPFVPDDSVGIEEYLGKRESDIYIYPNPTSGEAVVCGYMHGYTSIELYDLQGRKIADLVESHKGTSFPAFDLSPYPAGTYIVKINFERGVSVTRKVVKR